MLIKVKCIAFAKSTFVIWWNAALNWLISGKLPVRLLHFLWQIKMEKSNWIFSCFNGKKLLMKNLQYKGLLRRWSLLRSVLVICGNKDLYVICVSDSNNVLRINHWSMLCNVFSLEYKLILLIKVLNFTNILTNWHYNIHKSLINVKRNVIL